MHIHIRVGTRPSILALKQVEEIQRRIPKLIFDIVPIQTDGDRDKATPLTLCENSDFFTGDIEEALRRKKIDVAVHSAKDLEEDMPKDLVIAAMTRSPSLADCLVSSEHDTLYTLPKGARVGTSSKNRQEAIARYRSDLITQDIRGTIEERLAQLDRGDFDAIVVAHVALLRLGYQERISQIIPFDIIEPHPFQGRLAVQVRRDNGRIRRIFEGINEA